MDDLTLAEKWLAGIIAAGGVVLAWANGEAKRAKATDHLTARVNSHEKDIKVLQETHDKNLADIRREVKGLRDDMRTDIQNVWQRAEERHDQVNAKLDRLIERGK